MGEKINLVNLLLLSTATVGVLLLAIILIALGQGRLRLVDDLPLDEEPGVEGVASWYGDEYAGKIMANGQPFNPSKMTAACNHYALGTTLEVTHARRSVKVTVTDRGPRRDLGRLIDLSQGAFTRLASPDTGLIYVTVRVVASPSK